MADIEIGYKGSTIASMTSSGTTTLDTAGTYCEDDITITYDKVQGSAFTPATTISVTPTISIDSNGLITASNNGTSSITPTVTAGYITSGTAGTITVNGSNTSQLNSLAASTWTPTTTSQIISSGTYLTGNQTIAGDSNLVASNIASGVSIFGVNGTFQGGGDLESITIKPENCTSSSTQITPETYICETDSSYPGTVISFNNTGQKDIGNPLPNNIKIELNKTYHCDGQLLIKWDDDNTEEYYYINSNFKITSYTTIVSLSFTWEGSTGAVQTFGTIYIKMTSYQPYGYQTILRVVRNGAITKSGVLLPGSFYRIIQPETEGYEVINLDFNSDPRFYGIYQSLAYRSAIDSGAPYVSEWIGSLNKIEPRQFAGQPFSSSINYAFNNVSYAGEYAFAYPNYGGQAGTFLNWSATFPIITQLGRGTFAYNPISEINCPLVTSIGTSAFYYCSKLTTISFPECTTIGQYAFCYCSKLTTISFPECTTIDQYAFQNCSNLTTISFSKCTTIINNAFYSCNKLTTISFPECTTINNAAFQYCSSLTTISFPECTTIGNSAFNNCSSLTTISFPKCTTIGNNAFQYCSNLTTISFPKCTSIGTQTFYQCSNLVTVDLPLCTYIGMQAFYSCVNLTEINAPNCSTLSNGAFQNCAKLSDISLPMCNIVSSSAFYNCSSLTTISLPNCTNIGNSAFYSCVKLSSIYFMGSSIPSITNTTFNGSPFSNSTYLGYFGSIYVPSSLLDSYKTATNWITYSARMVGV